MGEEPRVKTEVDAAPKRGEGGGCSTRVGTSQAFLDTSPNLQVSPRINADSLPTFHTGNAHNKASTIPSQPQNKAQRLTNPDFSCGLQIGYLTKISPTRWDRPPVPGVIV